MEIITEDNYKKSNNINLLTTYHVIYYCHHKRYDEAKIFMSDYGNYDVNKLKEFYNENKDRYSFILNIKGDMKLLLRAYRDSHIYYSTRDEDKATLYFQHYLKLNAYLDNKGDDDTKKLNINQALKELESGTEEYNSKINDNWAVISVKGSDNGK